ncbi:hypothetical protein M3182_02965 [Mesobacillus maritimus]|uniref:hypothetical protein n=1 Tax=Mesobacillus maritimus TaxID=1643336 RepID=UPI00203C4D30|nr:hypothetical protein [Mesobacillus maritimus]MCM3584705.1 hypothetical protein [Mesobacillus maritimus]MCM3671305.1 hypothetical protein [Mesobacillus maritimus]
MKIVITLLIVFLITFLLIFAFIFRSNKQESEEEKTSGFMVIFVSILFSLVITGTIGLILFAIFGSTSLVNSLFSLHISTNQLVVVTIAFFIYLFTLDNLLEWIVKWIIGKNLFYTSLLAFLRIGIFYAIANLVGLTQNVSITIAAGVAFILLFIEVSYEWRKKSKMEIGGSSS